MRWCVVALFSLVFPAAEAAAQSCERMTVKNQAGQIVSDGVMCLDADGVWTNQPVPPAPETVATAPAISVAEEAVQQAPETAIPAETAAQPPVPAEPALLPETAAEAPPLVVETVETDSVADTVLPAEPVVETVVPVKVVPEPSNPVVSAEPGALAVALPQPVPPDPVEAALPVAADPGGDDGRSQRQEAYAKLGLVCVAKKAMHCKGDCSGKCAGKSGWCDGASGKLYPSLEAIERRYCKPK